MLDWIIGFIFHYTYKVEGMKVTRVIGFLVVALCVLPVVVGTPTASMQSGFTLSGEWIVHSSPLNGKVSSPKGLTLGFPDRDMFFEEHGDLRTGMVLREDVGQNVTPLGVWRVSGDTLSTTFQLWCPDTSGPCGSIMMRGRFTSEDRIIGTMTAFFTLGDDATPTGYDTWTFNFVGNRVAGPANGGSN